MFSHRALVFQLIFEAALASCVAQSTPPTPAPNLQPAAESQPGSPPPPALPIVHTWVHVTANPGEISLDRTSPQPFEAIAADILPSAGTYGDFSRYLQTMPGVLGDGDWSNDIIVRGGNPMENLFLVDGIEVPNLNQLTFAGTSGGLLTMIDTAAIQSVDLYTGGYDASYSERLSSVVDIRTRTVTDLRRHGEADLGYIGAGGLAVVPLNHNGSLLASAHRSYLNLISNNIGLGGTPVYSNLFLRGRFNPSHADEVTLLSLSGWDRLDTQPGGPGHNALGTTQIDMQYSGWRITNGFRWRHVRSPRFFNVLTASDSEDHHDIRQQDTLRDIVRITPKAARQLPHVPIYSQLSDDGRATLRYDLVWDFRPDWSVMSGISGALHHLHYRVSQPLGGHSPLSIDPAATDAGSFAANLLTGEGGAYGELTWRPFTHWSVTGGGRLQAFALGGQHTATPRLNTVYRFTPHTGLHFAWGEYAQMPPAIDQLSWPQNRTLLPIRARHLIAGLDLWTGSHARIGIEAYRKSYRQYPVSSEYPSLSLANVVQDIGKQILWIPLISRGTGLAQGIELSASARIGARLSAQANLAYARTRYVGLDGVLRPGNFDYPLVFNTSGTWRPAKNYEFSWRYEYTSGRPYTPYLLQQSMLQNRPIYDLSKINALRGPDYSRMDIETSRTFHIGSHRLVVYAGVDNVWNHKNFLGYYWLPRIGAYYGCKGNPKNCLTEVDSFSRFPDGGIRFNF